MTSRDTWFERARMLGLAALVAGSLVACDGGLLDVEDPDVVQPEEELSPASVPARFAGMINDFREAYDDYVLYTGLHTDEFILAGTFPTRIEVDERRPISNNSSIDFDVWQPLSVSRATADALDDDFSPELGNDEFDQRDLQQGISWARLLGGYDRIFLAEFMCQSIFGGQEDFPQFVDEEAESSPKTSQERMQEAVGLLESAESFANANGFTDVATAARIGQARAHMFLGSVTGDAGRFSTAADLADDVPTDFELKVDFSAATPGEKNEVFQSTWGVDASIRWTVGNGEDATRGNEKWEYLAEWLDQGLLIDAETSRDQAGLEAFNGRSPVVAQTLYASRTGTTEEAPILLATGWEADMIEAEVLLRGGSPGPAEDMVNGLLTDEDQTLNPLLAVEPALNGPAPAGAFTTEELEAFAPVTFGDESLKGDLIELARARSAGMWMTGSRQGYLRRLAVEFNDRLVGGLWPDRSSVNSISLPVPADEVDNNKNIDQPCPAGLP